MMQKIQRFGGAMFTPVLLFAFSGIIIGIGTIFQNELIMGSIAAPTTNWWKVWNVIREGAWTVFRQVPLLFTISLPIALAKKQQARCCMEAFVLYVTFNYMLAALCNNWGSVVGVDYSLDAASGTGLTMIASIKTLDTGMVGAIIIAGVVVYIHNRFFDTKLPDWLGTFKGSSFVCVLGFFAMLVLAVIFFFVWPQIQNALKHLQNFFISSGAFGVWSYSFLERILIPTGLHHFIYMPFVYDSAVVAGGIEVAWAEQLSTIAQSTGSLVDLFPAGGFSLYGWGKMVAPFGIAVAFYTTAKPGKKKNVLSLMIPVCLTAFLCGITEPIEFTFLFIAPVLFFVHAIISATFVTILYTLGISGNYVSGFIKNASLNFIPLWKTHHSSYLLAFAVCVVFAIIWFVVFRILIVKMNLATPGREEDNEETKLVSKAEYKASKAQGAKATEATKAAIFLEGLGGKDNIQDVTNCATRLRVTVKDPDIVKSVDFFKQGGAHGLVKKGKALQVIVGLSVPQVRDEFEKLL